MVFLVKKWELARGDAAVMQGYMVSVVTFLFTPRTAPWTIVTPVEKDHREEASAWFKPCIAALTINKSSEKRSQRETNTHFWQMTFRCDGRVCSDDVTSL